MAKSNTVVVALGLAAAVGVGTYYFLKNHAVNTPFGPARMSYEQATAELASLAKQISWREDIVQRRAKIKLGQKKDLKSTLPDISQYPLTVDPLVSEDDVVAEVFVTTIRGWSPVVPGRTRTADGRFVEVAKAFNAADVRLVNGKKARLRVRYIASGTGYQFIAARKYLPDAFSPVHHMWIRMADAHGLKMTPISEKMVTSIGGIVMKNEVAFDLKEKYGTLDTKAIINEVAQGSLAMGYTNPFHSSTGLNFLISVLSTFADGKEDAFLSPDVVSAFEKFQRGVPFVALTTVQMRDAVLNDGSLDAFIMGHQTFLGAKALQSGYQFIPFGIKHDHPLYAVGDIGAEKTEVLKLFADFADQPAYQELASEYGWNQKIALDYKSDVPLPSGQTLIQAQKIWKQKKDAGRPIAAVFLCDTSGSMAGTRIRGVREALIAGSEFISPANSIGLVLFNDQVSTALPIKKFNLNHRAAFQAAAEDMNTGGGTAMYDGITAALTMLVEEKKKNPAVKPVLFVLTDGNTQTGIDYQTIAPVIQGIKIPIYTIGYEANLSVLKELSSLVEAANVNAGEGDVQYKIGSLLNAQM